MSIITKLHLTLFAFYINLLIPLQSTTLYPTTFVPTVRKLGFSSCNELNQEAQPCTCFVNEIDCIIAIDILKRTDCIYDATFGCISTMQPTISPSIDPTMDPVVSPTNEPTPIPTPKPTVSPTIDPTTNPTMKPTQQPIAPPTIETTSTTTTTSYPSYEPTVATTATPTIETTSSTTTTSYPSYEPTVATISSTSTTSSTVYPTYEPTMPTSTSSTSSTTAFPSYEPTMATTAKPTKKPTRYPTPKPTRKPTVYSLFDSTSTSTTPWPSYESTEDGNICNDYCDAFTVNILHYESLIKYQYNDHIGSFGRRRRRIYDDLDDMDDDDMNVTCYTYLVERQFNDGLCSTAVRDIVLGACSSDGNSVNAKDLDSLIVNDVDDIFSGYSDYWRSSITGIKVDLFVDDEPKQFTLCMKGINHDGFTSNYVRFRRGRKKTYTCNDHRNDGLPCLSNLFHIGLNKETSSSDSDDGYHKASYNDDYNYLYMNNQGGGDVMYSLDQTDTRSNILLGILIFSLCVMVTVTVFYCAMAIRKATLNHVELVHHHSNDGDNMIMNEIDDDDVIMDDIDDDNRIFSSDSCDSEAVRSTIIMSSECIDDQDEYLLDRASIDNESVGWNLSDLDIDLNDDNIYDKNENNKKRESISIESNTQRLSDTEPEFECHEFSDTPSASTSNASTSSSIASPLPSSKTSISSNLSVKNVRNTETERIEANQKHFERFMKFTVRENNKHNLHEKILSNYTKDDEYSNSINNENDDSYDNTNVTPLFVEYTQSVSSSYYHNSSGYQE